MVGGATERMGEAGGGWSQHCCQPAHGARRAPSRAAGHAAGAPAAAAAPLAAAPLAFALPVTVALPAGGCACTGGGGQWRRQVAAAGGARRRAAGGGVLPLSLGAAPASGCFFFFFFPHRRPAPPPLCASRVAPPRRCARRHVPAAPRVSVVAPIGCSPRPPPRRRSSLGEGWAGGHQGGEPTSCRVPLGGCAPKGPAAAAAAAAARAGQAFPPCGGEGRAPRNRRAAHTRGSRLPLGCIGWAAPRRHRLLPPPPAAATAAAAASRAPDGDRHPSPPPPPPRVVTVPVFVSPPLACHCGALPAVRWVGKRYSGGHHNGRPERRWAWAGEAAAAGWWWAWGWVRRLCRWADGCGGRRPPVLVPSGLRPTRRHPACRRCRRPRPRTSPPPPRR